MGIRALVTLALTLVFRSNIVQILSIGCLLLGSIISTMSFYLQKVEQWSLIMNKECINSPSESISEQPNRSKDER